MFELMDRLPSKTVNSTSDFVQFFVQSAKKKFDKMLNYTRSTFAVDE